MVSVAAPPPSVHMQSVHLSFPTLLSAPSLVGTATLGGKSADAWGVDNVRPRGHVLMCACIALIAVINFT